MFPFPHRPEYAMQSSNTITAKTYKATFDGNTTIYVGGLHAPTILSERPDTGARLEARNSLRREILATFKAKGIEIGPVDWTLS